MIKNIILGILTIIVIVLGGLYLYNSRTASVGAVPVVNPDASHFTNPVYAGGGIVVGGGVFSTSTATTTDALTESETQYSLIVETPTATSTTLYLPVFSKLLTNVGDATSFFVQNGTTTAATKVTLAAPVSGTTLTLASTSAVITAGVVVPVQCVRISSATSTCFVY